MKKTLVSALTTALVVGAASTTFAAANPFEDVPADHWAYDAIAQLAADGVIEGYGDGTYRGDQEITRYEMAQMIARAMAKGGGDKALIDKLAAEFADELNNLGVRVAALEKKVDNVKWQGIIRYRYINRHESDGPDRTQIGAGPDIYGAKKNNNQLLLRLDPTFQINKHWTGKARIDYLRTDEMDSAANMNGESSNGGANLDRVWVEGKYDNFLLKLGKFPVFTNADYGMTMNYRIAGAEATFGKDVQVSLRGGRLNTTDSKAFMHGGNSSGPAGAGNYTHGKLWNGNDNGLTADVVSYYGVEVFGDRSKKFTWGLGWQHVRGDKNHSLRNSGTDDINIFNLGLGYKFDKNVKLTGAYSWSTGLEDATQPGHGAANLGQNFDQSKYKYSYAFQLNYKGADKAKRGSWGAWVGYRHLGDFNTIYSTYTLNGPQWGGEKGLELGVNYAFDKNIVGAVQYFRGTELYNGHSVNSTWAELVFSF